MPYLSIICCTPRVGGMDVLLAGLSRQTYRDFELVLVDALCARRREVVAEQAKRLRVPLKHMAPFSSQFPNASYCRYANTGIAEADGEVVLFIADYTWLPPDGVERHAMFHRSSTTHRGMMAPHVYFKCPAPHPAFRGYAEDEIDSYVADLATGRLDQVMWSLWRDDSRPWFEWPKAECYDADVKTRMPSGPIEREHFFAKNESCRRADLIKINGWDESMDGCQPYLDSEIADRLFAVAGVTWIHDNQNLARIVNPRGLFPRPREIRSPNVNHDEMLRRRAQGSPTWVNNWRLDDQRTFPKEARCEF
jgi:glycosyltransferase involved in cell wall biosynthesis